MTAYGVVDRIERCESRVVPRHITHPIAYPHRPFDLAACNKREGDIWENTEATAINGIDAIVGIGDTETNSRVSAPFMPFFAAIGLPDKIEIGTSGYGGNGQLKLYRMFDDMPGKFIYFKPKSCIGRKFLRICTIGQNK